MASEHFLSEVRNNDSRNQLQSVLWYGVEAKAHGTV
jgi:hypothetical protein